MKNRNTPQRDHLQSANAGPPPEPAQIHSCLLDAVYFVLQSKLSLDLKRAIVQTADPYSFRRAVD